MANNETFKDILGAKTIATPVPEKEIGIDTTQSFIEDILDATELKQLNTSVLDSLSNVAQTREEVYSLIDNMSQDDTIAAILETYTEDVVETNDAGNIVWCESTSPDVQAYVTYLLDSLNIDKHAFEWIYSLLKYGDLYLRLFHESDIKNDGIFGDKSKQTSFAKKQALNEGVENKSLNEDINVIVNEANDHFVHYVEAVANPGEMFELTKFGKTSGYIQAPVQVQRNYDKNDILNYYLRYKMNKKDIMIYSATDFVHACLQNDVSRSNEEVDIYTGDDNENDSEKYSYGVRKGQSLLYNSFRIWRELSLLENSLLLNRLTKSAIVRILNVETGDMPKEQVQSFMDRLKTKIEQKSAINTDVSMTEYTNPGPIENILYVPTHGTQGQISPQTIGGDVDIKSLIDVDYFQNKLFGSLRAPKQFFAQTSDSTGFNGGTSLTIISSRYGKAIKRYQNTFCQLVTDLINVFLLDKGMTEYINKFTIKMQPPITQEELDRRENLRNRIGVINDIMNQISNVVDDTKLKLEIVKILLSDASTNPEVITLLQDKIDEMNQEEQENAENGDNLGIDNEPNEFDDFGSVESSLVPTPMEFETETSEESGEELESEETLETPTEDSYLPNPAELGQDFVGNTETI